MFQDKVCAVFPVDLINCVEITKIHTHPTPSPLYDKKSFQFTFQHGHLEKVTCCSLYPLSSDLLVLTDTMCGR